MRVGGRSAVVAHTGSSRIPLWKSGAAGTFHATSLLDSLPPSLLGRHGRMDIHREPGIAGTAIHIQIRARQLVSKSALLRNPNSPSPTLPFVQLTKDRSNEIAQAIRDGIIDDPSARRTLDRAIDIIGTCLDFCSHYEKIERHLRNEVKRPEMACFTSPSFVPRALILVWRSPVRTRSPITVGWSRRLRVRTISTRRNYPRTSDRLISSRSIYRFHLTIDPSPFI